MIDASSSNHHRLEDDKVELKYSKKEEKNQNMKMNLKPTSRQCPVGKLLIGRKQLIIKLNPL